MIKSKNAALMGALAAMAFLSESPVPSRGRLDREFPEVEIKPKGKRFIIEGEEIWALNEKNARRKYNNKHHAHHS